MEKAVNPNRRRSRLQGLKEWMVPPASGWRPKTKGAFKSSGLFVPLTTLGACLTLLALLSLLPESSTAGIADWKVVEITLTLTSLLSLALVVWRCQRQLIDPLTHLRYWAMRMRGGHLLARIPEPPKGEFAELARDINMLSDSLRDLTRDMEEQVRIQTARTAQKSHSLKILYDVTRSINNSSNFEELLSHFLHTIKNLMHAQAATIRLLTENDELRLVAQVGMDNDTLEKERLFSIHRCQCGDAVQHGQFRCQDVVRCKSVVEQSLFKNSKLKMLAVPLKYRGKTLGIYNLFVEKNELIEREELTGLLTSIGQNLGVAIAKATLEDDARRLALMEERTLLSHELHDSLAQTLASLRMRVRMLSDTLDESGNQNAKRELSSLHSGLDKANSDLRELLDNFRTPMDERGLIPALQDMSQQLQKETGVAVYFQDQSQGHGLLPKQEVQVLHIVQEAMSNVRKHSRAKNVRLLVRADNDGHWQVLVEDDGIGLRDTNVHGAPGEHIGLSIMRERCRHLKGDLSIESEPGEGTRIELNFRHAAQIPDPVISPHAKVVNLLDHTPTGVRH